VLSNSSSKQLATVFGGVVFIVEFYGWQEVVDFCRSNLIENTEAFSSTRVELVINDARYP
jgi:hypothetical protein